jgi:oxygen-dependent protoporphyrinogen oxidase
VTLHVPVLIVGGGISGLACAHALRKAGVDARLIESSDRPGGAIRTERRDGYLLECGPQSFSGTAPLHELCAELGIEGNIIQGPPGAPRYVLVDGRLQQVPMSPPSFFTSDFVNLGTKWTMLRDLLGKSAPPEQDESIAGFVRRKFSAELLDRLVGPFVSGVYAGDPEKLSLRSSFPMLYEAEKTKGSVIRGLMTKPRMGPRQRPTLLSFRDGTETLARALSTRLGSAVRSNAEVTRAAFDLEGGGGKFKLQIQAAGQEEAILTDHLVVATPTYVAGRILRNLNPDFEPLFGAIEYAPVAVVSLGYKRPDIGDALHGFGFLVPRSAGLRVLGTVWNSSLFPDRAPDGHVLLTSFVGGATDPQIKDLSPEQLAALVHRELAPLLRIGENASAGRSEPPAYRVTDGRTGSGSCFSHVKIYPRALPQYNLGHTERLAAIEGARSKIPNLWLVGNYLSGPSIGACVEQSQKVAQEIVSRTKS